MEGNLAISIKFIGLPCWLSGKESACKCRIHEFNPWGGKVSGEGNSSPLPYSCLGNPMDRGAWWITVHRVRHDLQTKQEQPNLLMCAPFDWQPPLRILVYITFSWITINVLPSWACWGLSLVIVLEVMRGERVCY